ncbi:MAG: transglutaminase-like domain-containing protein [Clostridiales bacterium]|nr:transglutaminase-like domain-containing protein [Clostridiales bacterium]
MTRKASDYAFFLITGGLMVFSLAFNILNATIIPVSIPIIVFGIILSMILFSIIFHNHYTFLITLGFFAAFLMVIFAKWDNSWLSETNTAGLWPYVRGLILFIRGYLPYEDIYGPIITLSVCGFLALYMTLSLYVSFQFYFTALLGAGIFIVNWIMDYKRSELSFILFLFCFCVLMYKKMNSRKANVSLMAIYMMPVCLLVVVSAYFLPPLNREWDNSAAVEFLKKPLSNTNDFFYFIFNPKYFSFQATGFEGGDGRLGGSLSMNNREVMRVKADKPTYLAGLIKNTYTGNAWLSGKPGFTEPYSAEIARFEAVETQLNSLPDRDFTVRRLTVNIGDSRTGTIFRPLKNNGVEIDTDLALQADGFGDIRLSDVLPADAEYSYDYMDVDYSDPAVQNLLRNAREGFYREGVSNDMYVGRIVSLFDRGMNGSAAFFSPLAVLNYLRDYYELDQRYIWGVWEYQRRLNTRSLGFSISGYFEDDLIPYADYVYDTFLSLPEDLPQRVRDLAGELTASADNDYDRAKAIESYLVGFPYTLTPGTPPQGRDFVDYFLFDGQEGYCTYYASAMAVLCRCAGLPARYVEGYIMPSVPSDDGYYNITNLQAHAWSEVYFEGFGWVPFEATAPYSYSFYQQTLPLNQRVFTSEFASDPNYEEYREHMLEGAGGSAGVTKAPVSNNPDGSSDMTALAVPAALLLIFACCAFLILKGKFDIWREQVIIDRLPRNEQAIEYFRDIIKMTRYYRYPMRGYETPMTYAARIGKRFAFKNDSIFIRDLVHVYNKAKYAGVEIRGEDLALIKNCREELLAYIRYMRRKPVFIWNRYITRRI